MRIKKIFVPLICLAATVLFTIIGIQGIKDRKSFVETTAVITNITSTHVGDDTETTVEIKYTVDGNEINTVFGEYNAAMKVGKEIKIKYNPENPTETVSAGYTTVIIIFVMSFIALIATFISTVKFLNNRL